MDIIESKIGLIEYKIEKLEEAIDSIALIKNMVLRWDSRFGQDNNNEYFQCPVHNERMKSFETRIHVMETSIEELKKFVYKATGALVVISIVIQLSFPLMIGKKSNENSNIIPHYIMNGTNQPIKIQ